MKPFWWPYVVWELSPPFGSQESKQLWCCWVASCPLKWGVKKPIGRHRAETQKYPLELLDWHPRPLHVRGAFTHLQPLWVVCQSVHSWFTVDGRLETTTSTIFVTVLLSSVLFLGSVTWSPLRTENMWTIFYTVVSHNKDNSMQKNSMYLWSSLYSQSLPFRYRQQSRRFSVSDYSQQQENLKCFQVRGGLRVKEAGGRRLHMYIYIYSILHCVNHAYLYSTLTPASDFDTKSCRCVTLPFHPEIFVFYVFFSFLSVACQKYHHLTHGEFSGKSPVFSHYCRGLAGKTPENVHSVWIWLLCPHIHPLSSVHV